MAGCTPACPLHHDLALVHTFHISPSAANFWQGKLRAEAGMTSTPTSPWACHETQFTINQPRKSYVLGLRDLCSLQKGRSSTCFVPEQGLELRLFKGCTSDESRKLWWCVFLNMPFLSHLHVPLLSETLKHFAMFLALPQPLHRIQIKVGGCSVCLFIISLMAAPHSSQEGRKRQSVAVFPAIQLLSSPHDLDQEGIGKEGEQSCRRAK